MKNRNMYILIILLSIILFVVAITILGNTKFIAPLIIVISAYLFFGSIIKICKTNDKLKNTILCAIDLLFWLP